MSLILNIDTATEIAHVSIAKDGFVLKDLFNEEQKTHAGFLQPAIKQLLKEAGIILTDLDAIAVTKGPGSYTGLRIAMASAKGLCFAINKPLITIDTLELIARSAIIKLQDQPINAPILLCPMIDARRMEVFTALYDLSLKNILPSCAMILEENSFKDFFNNYFIIFFGGGSKKWENICYNKNSSFQQVAILSEAMSDLSEKKFGKNDLCDIAYSQPAYIKDFYIK